MWVKLLRYEQNTHELEIVITAGQEKDIEISNAGQQPLFYQASGIFEEKWRKINVLKGTRFFEEEKRTNTKILF